MPRKKRVSLRRVVAEDLKYHDKLVAKFINQIMWEGKKAKAASIVYGAFDRIKEKKGQEPLELFKKALENIKPTMEVRSRRVGGANYQVPIEVRPERRTALAIAIRCCSPPDNFIPLSPTTVSYPSGSLVIKSCAFAIFADSMILSSVTSSSPNAILSRTLA